MDDRDPRATWPAVPDGLRELITDGVPAHPIPAFDDALSELNERALAARRSKDAQESRLLEDAVSLVERFEAELETVEEQLVQLETVRSAFEVIGEFGAQDLHRVVEMIGLLSSHRDRLRARLESPALAEACRRREGLYRHKRERVADALAAAGTPEAIDDAITDLLGIIRPADAEWAMGLAEELERSVRGSTGPVGLAPVLRFWRQVRSRASDALAGRIQEKSRSLQQEISEHETARDSRAAFKTLLQEVHKGIEHLDRLGCEERIVMIHLWLGRMRRLQDECDLDEDTERDLHFTFGALNSARKKLDIGHYFDALNRKFGTNWEAYVADWASRLEDARRKDRLAAEHQQIRRNQEAQRERAEQERRAEKTRRLDYVVEALHSRRGEEVTGPEDVEEVRELIAVGVEADGCQSGEFLEAVKPLAAHVWGGEFRSLRRSLKKVGVDEAVFGTPPPEPENRVDRLMQSLRPALEGRRLAIVGGLPVEATRSRIESGLGLAELRWFEHYRGRDEQDAAIASVNALGYDAVVLLVRYAGHKINGVKDACKSAGVPCRLVDRGCGVTRILRALAEPAPGGSVAGVAPAPAASA